MRSFIIKFQPGKLLKKGDKYIRTKTKTIIANYNFLTSNLQNWSITLDLALILILI